MSAYQRISGHDELQWFFRPGSVAGEAQMQLLLWSLPGASPIELTPEAVGCLHSALDPHHQLRGGTSCEETPAVSALKAACVILRAALWQALDGSRSVAIARRMSATLAVLVHLASTVGGRFRQRWNRDRGIV